MTELFVLGPFRPFNPHGVVVTPLTAAPHPVLFNLYFSSSACLQDSPAPSPSVPLTCNKCDLYITW